jgi:hypothetical protein
MVTAAEIRGSLASLRNTDIAPMGTMNMDVVAGLLALLVSGGGVSSGGGGVASTVSVSNFPSTPGTDAAPVTEAALTAAGSTAARSVANYRYYSYQVQVTGIGTNVALRKA